MDKEHNEKFLICTQQKNLLNLLFDLSVYFRIDSMNKEGGISLRKDIQLGGKYTDIKLVSSSRNPMYVNL